MRRFGLAALCVPFLLVAAPALQAGEAPAVVVRVKSLDVLVQNVNLVVRLVGQDNAAKQIEGLIKSKIGKKGLEGVDPTRPFGAYVRFGKTLDDVSGAILIPIVDEKTFLELLDNTGVAYKKDKDGIFTHKTDKNVDLFFRFEHKYLYVTGGNAESIHKKNLPDPAKALAAAGDAAISVAARIDQIPKDAKLVALSQLDDAVKAAQQQAQPNETKTLTAFRVALLDEFHKFASGIIRDAAELRVDLDVNEKTKDLNVSFNVSATPGTDLAKTIKSIGELKSPLANLAAGNVAFQGTVHLALPDPLNKAFVKVIDEVKVGAINGIQDKDKKAQAKTLFDALMPTARAGEFQVAAAVIGPKDERYTFLGAVKLKDGTKLGNTVHDLLKEALKSIPEKDRGKYRLDIDPAGPFKIHKLEIPKDDPNLDKFLTDVAGDNQLYLAFRDDALFLALGKEALPTLKTALAKTASTKSQPLLFDFDVARMASLMAKTDEQKDLAAKLFPQGESGRVRLNVEGGERLSARLQMRLNVLEFLMKLKNEKEQQENCGNE